MEDFLRSPQPSTPVRHSRFPIRYREAARAWWLKPTVSFFLPTFFLMGFERTSQGLEIHVTPSFAMPAKYGSGRPCALVLVRLADDSPGLPYLVP